MSGIPDVFPPGFWPEGKSVDKNTGTYVRVKGQRKNAKISAYGAAAATRQQLSVEDVPFICYHSAETIEIPAATFRGLIKKDSTGSNLIIDEKGADEVARQIKEAAQAMHNLRISAKTSAFFQGNIWWDAKGNLLPSATGAQTTASFGIPAGNQGQLNVFGTGNIISASWANTATNIEDQIILLQQAAIRLTGYPIKYAFYGANIPSYLVQNTTLQNFFSRGQVPNMQYLTTGAIPNPLLGLTWVPAYESFFEDQFGVPQSVVGNDEVVFTPAPSSDWHEIVMGKYDVPGEDMLGKTGIDLLADLDVAEGPFMYANLELDPIPLGGLNILPNGLPKTTPRGCGPSPTAFSCKKVFDSVFIRFVFAIKVYVGIPIKINKNDRSTSCHKPYSEYVSTGLNSCAPDVVCKLLHKRK